jgi:hypothetical protein
MRELSGMKCGNAQKVIAFPVIVVERFRLGHPLEKGRPKVRARKNYAVEDVCGHNALQDVPQAVRLLNLRIAMRPTARGFELGYCRLGRLTQNIERDGAGLLQSRSDVGLDAVADNWLLSVLSTIATVKRSLRGATDDEHRRARDNRAYGVWAALQDLLETDR